MRRTGLGNKLNEVAGISENALGGLGWEPHTELCGDVKARLTGVGPEAPSDAATRNAIALRDLLLVQALLQTASVSPPGSAAVGRTVRRSRHARIVGGRAPTYPSEHSGQRELNWKILVRIRWNPRQSQNDTARRAVE